MITPQIRTGLTHVGTALGGAIAAIGFMSQNSVDLYAMWNQLDTVIAEITKLVAMITPFATAAYGIYKASTKSKLEDIINDPKAPGLAHTLPVTPKTEALADALKA